MALTMGLMFFIIGIVVFVTLLARNATVATVETCCCGRFVASDRPYCDKRGIMHRSERCSPIEEEL